MFSQANKSVSLTKVKFLGNYSSDAWKRQFPRGQTVWGQCQFTLDANENDYDWLVVYNDFPGNHQEELLRCPASQTLLITMEPPTIKSYGRAYTNQFGYVLTSQPAWALPHKNRMFSQCALQWYYGYGSTTMRNYDQLVADIPLKTKNLSTVCSTKRQRHTLHNLRYEFTQQLKVRIPEMDVFGHGVKEMDDKAEALDEYRYHLAIENYIGEHHWTEKLADVFLGAALPFYSGCPNAVDYFPEESFIPIDISDVDGAAEIILKAIRDDEYQKRLPYILEARCLVLDKYNMFAVLSEFIRNCSRNGDSVMADRSIMSRRLLRKRKPIVSIWDAFEKSRLRIMQAFGRQV